MSLFRDLLIEKKRKPYYCEIEYIEETENNAFFNTHIFADETTAWEIRMSFNTTTTGQLMGSGSTQNSRFNMGIESNKFRFAYGSRWFDAYTTTPDTDPHTFRLEATSSVSADGYIDGQKASVTVPSTTPYIPQEAPVTLMCRSTSGTADDVTILSGATCKGKIYYSKIWKGGMLVSDLIPVLDWNYTPCLYDRVTKKLIYPLVGTTAGSQTAGNPSKGREIHYVDYLESDANQYLNLGLKYKSSMSVKGKFTRTEQGMTGSVILLSTNTQNPVFYFPGIQSSNKIDRYVWRRNGYTEQSYFLEFSSYPITEEVYLDAINDKLYLNDELVLEDMIAGMGGYDSPYESSSVMGMFGMADGQFLGAGKVYYCKIWDGTELIRDINPAIDEDGVGFMFDKVTHTCYLNLGTGKFKYPAREVSYLETTGGSYLDTGFNPNTNGGTFTFDVEVKCISNSNGHGAIGSRSSDNVRNWVITNVNNVGSSGYIGQQYGYGNTYKNLVSDTSNKWARMRTYVDGSNYVMEATVDSVSYTETTPVQTFTNTANVYLLNINNKGSVFSNFNFIGQMRRAKLYDNGTLVKDYKPAFKNGYFGLWDSVNDYLPTISGTGTITYGKIVESRWF